jgi:hypothetical protein
MQIVHADAIAPRVISGHRTGHIEFQQLLQGDPAALDNFELSLVHNRGSYYTPRHRHNFEQVRFIVAGEFEYATRKTMKTGAVGFFPEGTFYGPQNVTECTALTLQCGGPSRAGFMSYQQLHNGHLELKKLGAFADGIFTRDTSSNRGPGVRKNQDGYEAIWEHVRARKLTYPKQRYSEPVIMYPDSMSWAASERSGVARKLLGVFDGNVRIEMLRIERGAIASVAAERAIQLLFAVSGRGQANGQDWSTHAAIKIERGEEVALSASEDSVVLLMGMAELHDARAEVLAA